jgi:conjugative relaxase-like TrwC/TraI family protein
MLTCKTISPQRAVNYFVKGYYLGDNSRWSGKGAAKLKLSGEVDNETKFANVVLGYSPDGRRKLAGKNLASDKRRAGVDCTFSAPKSVSLTALVGGDERLIEAHRKAVEKTLAVIEERYSHTRVRDGVYRNIVKTGNLVVAEFDHIETRELDPHLHTHCLIMNMTEVKRGKWYSHHNEAIFENKKFLGTLYQHYLAQGVEELGYEIQSKGKGQFEIQGYKQEDLEAFSKRRQQILEQVGEHSSWFTKEKAWDRSRKKKQVIHPDDLKAHWREEAQLLGIEFVVPSIKTASSSEPEANTYEKRKLTYNSAPDASFLNRQSIDEAIAHCSERHEAFKQEDLETFILAEHRSVDLATLDQEIASHPELIYIPYEKGVRYTTQKAIFRELNTIKLMQDGKETVGAISNSETASEYLSSLSLTDGQYMAIATALTSSDQFIAWQGVAGAGKTYALKHFAEIAIKNGFSVRGFAPSAEAAKILSEEVSIDSETVASLLHSQKSDGDLKQQQIWIVDEAGLLSAKAANQLLQRATEQKARVIFVGDTRQLSAVEAGNSFKSLQQAGIKTAFMDESLRQRVEHLQVAVDAISRGEITTGFNVLDSNGCIQSFDGQEDKIKAIVADYLAISPDERQKTLVLAGTNWERLQITEQIREKLKDEGRLGESLDVNQLKAKDLTAIQMKFAHNFDVGDVVMPTKSYKRRSLEKGLFYVIVAKGKDTVTLRSPDGQELTVDLGFEKAVYSQLSLEVAVGDLP